MEGLPRLDYACNCYRFLYRLYADSFFSSVLSSRRTWLRGRVAMEERAAESRNTDRNNDIRNRNFGRNFFIPVLYEIFSIGRGGSGGVLESLQNIFTFDHKLWFLPMKFLIGAYDQQQLTGGLPNIYVSLFCIPFLFVVFVDKRNKAKHKWAYFIAIGIMLLSFCFHRFKSDLAWIYLYIGK